MKCLLAGCVFQIWTNLNFDTYKVREHGWRYSIYLSVWPQKCATKQLKAVSHLPCSDRVLNLELLTLEYWRERADETDKVYKILQHVGKSDNEFSTVSV